MTMPQKEKDPLWTIEEVLKEKAPEINREQKRSGSLARFLSDQEAEMMRSYREEDEIRYRWAKMDSNDCLAYIQAFETITRELWKRTLATFLEFADPPEPTTY